MGNLTNMGDYVSDFAAKVDALVKLSRIGTREDLADSIGTSASSLRRWMHGNEVTQPGSIPDGRLDDVVEAFARHLPDRSLDEARALLLGPKEGLVSALLTDQTDWSSFVARFADKEGIELTHPEIDGSSKSAVAIDRARPALPSLVPGARFAIRTKNRLGRTGPFWLAALQWINGAWSPLPVDESEASRSPGAELRLPGAESWYVIKETARDELRLVLVTSGTPFDPHLRLVLRGEDVLMRSDLSSLASFLRRQKDGHWCLASGRYWIAA